MEAKYRLVYYQYLAPRAKWDPEVHSLWWVVRRWYRNAFGLAPASDSELVQFAVKQLFRSGK